MRYLTLILLTSILLAFFTNCASLTPLNDPYFTGADLDDFVEWCEDKQGMAAIRYQMGTEGGGAMVQCILLRPGSGASFEIATPPTPKRGQAI